MRTYRVNVGMRAFQIFTDKAKAEEQAKICHDAGLTNIWISARINGHRKGR